ncbi:hypothetical protein ACFOGJ_09710 [Marinibaculum pumilum]|uniref:DNA recombination protein RmuC n=1 Tax=Marinibaculum pumilum TaxID=1766165 RepID=A0ABV7KYL1_9PROT
MNDHASLFLLVTVLVLATILAIFGMKYLAVARAGRAAQDAQVELRALADRAAAAQVEAAAAMRSLQSDVAAVRARLDAIDGLLREVA